MSNYTELRLDDLYAPVSFGGGGSCSWNGAAKAAVGAVPLVVLSVAP